jgi:hypothetical protein
MTILDVQGIPLTSTAPPPAPYAKVLRVEGYGATRNLHLLASGRLDPVNAWLRRAGGLNRHNGPMYRVVWGWERPRVYGLGGGSELEFFHLERWMPFDHLITEDEWERTELGFLREIPSYEPEPYPRHGDYLNINTCRWGVKDTDGKRVAKFRWPDSPANFETELLWFEGAFVKDQIRLARTREEVAEAVVEDQKLLRQRERENVQRIEDDFMIRELIEDQTATLFRNPTLRKEPSFMLSPTTGKRRRRRAMVH